MTGLTAGTGVWQRWSRQRPQPTPEGAEGARALANPAPARPAGAMPTVSTLHSRRTLPSGLQPKLVPQVASIVYVTWLSLQNITKTENPPIYMHQQQLRISHQVSKYSRGYSFLL